ncbi:hypothetical protein KKH82_07520 [Patescibacteria group bacterium]|nr:hypothetical protein [Patescibacteria group bacterium]
MIKEANSSGKLIFRERISRDLRLGKGTWKEDFHQIKESSFSLKIFSLHVVWMSIAQ